MARLRRAGCVFAEDEARLLILTVQESTENAANGTALLDELLARRAAGDPLEQIVGWVQFAGQRVAVAPRVFVPRQRTVLLAQRSVRAVEATGNRARFLEAFCGVGPVAAVVSRALPQTRIHLGDHDQTALDCALRNVGSHVEAHLLSCLDGLPQELVGNFDVISAVPPYVPDSAAEFLPREALDHEAATALFGGADGLDLVRRLIAESRRWLAPDGALLIELGNEQRLPAEYFATAAGFAIVASSLSDDEQTVVLELRRSP